jgi:hypothetical protein
MYGNSSTPLIDFAGGYVVHLTGSSSGIVLNILLGPRKGYEFTILKIFKWIFEKIKNFVKEQELRIENEKNEKKNEINDENKKIDNIKIDEKELKVSHLKIEIENEENVKIKKDIDIKKIKKNNLWVSFYWNFFIKGIIL